ncbi:hypothetical protein [Sporosarcina sp. FSL K6-1508]|uniref:hypothetical protein n=1 Tax=Sporosarcina sp. FSL K6-1508 TaxID=2921553 RepID=UPI0030F700F5
MGKVFRTLLTRGINGLIDEDEKYTNTLAVMFRIAREFYEQSYFIAFNKEGKKVIITDGNENIFGELDLTELNIPENIWLVTDDYSDELVCVAMLPEEY